MKDSEDILTTYIQKVLKLQQEHQHAPLSVDELEKVAQDLGLTETDIQFLDQKFQDYPSCSKYSQEIIIEGCCEFPNSEPNCCEF